jgi:type IV pilus assembly protein PilC
MRSPQLSNLEISDICRELALLLHSGIGAADGLYLMAEEEKEPRLHALLTCMAAAMDNGSYLHNAFEEADCFPAYITGLLRVGEEVGRTEETLQALAQHYESREQTRRQIVSSLTYPAILLMLMLVVILVLLTKVLPVFDEVYASLGGHLSGVAGGLLLLGRGLDAAMPLLCAVLGAGAVLVALFSLHEGFRGKVLAFWRKKRGDKGVSRKLNDARFAQALAMGLSSGLPLEEAVDMSAALLKDVPEAAARCKTCRELLEEGESLSKALGETGLLPAASCRLLTLGIRGGSGDEVMEDIARRLSEEAQLALEDQVSKVEPALVLVTSVLVGAILLSVMLPLMNIMTAIG